MNARVTTVMAIARLIKKGDVPIGDRIGAH